MLNVKDYPDHHDADLVLKIYELRREPVMREARTKVFQFLPRSYDELKDVIGKREHPLNAPLRQTSGYWEMVYGMARHGIVHPDFLIESNGEGLFLFAKVHPYLADLRRDVSPRAFQNAEWIVTQCETGKAMFAETRERVRKMMEKK